MMNKGVKQTESRARGLLRALGSELKRYYQAGRL
jgi:hypothetical protein